MKMFAVIYRGFIRPGFEKDYQKAWNTIAVYFLKNCGAYGSALHQTEKGEWIAYSRWPSKEVRDQAWVDQHALPEEIKKAIQTLKNCTDPNKPSDEIPMGLIKDLLT
jgi:hypothetical protein